VWAALTGPHAPLAEIHGDAARYPADMSPFAALRPGSGPAGWADLAALVGPGGTALLAGRDLAPPAGWERILEIAGVQLVDTATLGRPADRARLVGGPAGRARLVGGPADDARLDAVADPDARVLGPADVPQMLDLVKRTEPGPFAQRTIELGRYLGFHDGDALIAMAGERLRLPGWVEISAVCTDPAYRGQGLAARLVRAVVAGIRAGGDVPFLHTAAHNTTAIRLYEALGFTHRQPISFVVVRTPPVA
jgi:ribosomal protein S18 acetylase RimI-like enzyme